MITAVLIIPEVCHSICPFPWRSSAWISSMVPVAEGIICSSSGFQMQACRGEPLWLCPGSTCVLHLFSDLGCLAAGQGLLDVFIHRCLVPELVSIVPVCPSLCTAAHTALSGPTVLDGLFHRLLQWSRNTSQDWYKGSICVFTDNGKEFLSSWNQWWV